MKINRIQKYVETNYYVHVEGTTFPIFRRSEHGSWENLMGESWEPCYLLEEELEKQFQLEWFGESV